MKRAGLAKAGAMIVCVAMLAWAGCSGEGDPGRSSGAVPVWELTLSGDGTTVTLPLHIMNVYLVEDHRYPETYELEGDGVVLAGEFPLDVHVDYDEAWEKLLGKSVAIKPKGGADGATESMLTLPGYGRLKVVGGSFTSEKYSGKYAGLEGDLTLSGSITIRVQTASGEKEYSGRFAVQCVSWG